MDATTEAFLCAGIFGFGIEIAKTMIKKYGKVELRKKLEESGDLDKEKLE